MHKSLLKLAVSNLSISLRFLEYHLACRFWLGQSEKNKSKSPTGAEYGGGGVREGERGKEGGEEEKGRRKEGEEGKEEEGRGGEGGRRKEGEAKGKEGEGRGG